MTRTIELTTVLPADPDRVWETVRTPALLDHVARPVLRFVPEGGTWSDERWATGEYRVTMYFGGVLPIGWQVIGIEYPEPRGETRFLRDNGHGPLIRRWDHWIVVEPAPEDGTRYIDRVHIDAGLLTPLVAACARAFYAHRQRRWRKLAEQNFRPLA